MKQINFDNVSFGYKKPVPLFEELSFAIKTPSEKKGHIVVVMGASGSGKSTLLKLILGIEDLWSGKIQYHPSNAVVSYLPQDPILFEHLSIYHNACYFSKIKSYKSRFNIKKFNDLARILNLNKVLSNSNSVMELSGGQKQRLSLLRAMSIQPDIILLDEPTTGLDPDVKLNFLHKFRRITLENKQLAIYITHHNLEAELIADEIVYIPENSTRKAITKIYQKSLIDFLKEPPTLDSANMLSFPKSKHLRCKIVNNRIFPAHETDSDYFFIVVNPNNISFQEEGHDFVIVSKNPIYTQIELGTDQLLTIDSSEIDFTNIRNMKLSFSGEVLTYRKDKFLTIPTHLKNNKIDD